MGWKNPDSTIIKDILERAKTIAVVGLSPNPERTSHQIAKIMQQSGYKIIPVNPTTDEVLDEQAYPSLVDVPEPFDIINVFRRSEHLPAIAKEAVKTDCNVFWAQQGIVNEEAYNYLKRHDFTVIMDLCIKVQHSLLVKKA
ncbi:MAG TPA: CoA-binding protein [Bacillota bacterium]|nr:CoA-binding protein [Bacillota bacterium]